MALITAKEFESRISHIIKNQTFNTTIGCGKGVVAKVNKDKTVTFFYRGRNEKGEPIKEMIGKFPRIKLARAREIAETYKKKEGKALANKAPYFCELANEWLSFLEAKGLKRIANKRTIIKHLSGLDRYRIDKIRPEVVRAYLTKLQVSAYVKRDCLNNLNQCLDFAITCGYIEQNANRKLVTIFEEPPATAHASLPPEDLEEIFFPSLVNTPILPRLGLLFILMTMLRLSEGLSIKWEWIDYQEKKISIPAEFMKMKRPHMVPLTKNIEQLLEIIKRVTGGRSPYVFPGIRDDQKPLPKSRLQEVMRNNPHLRGVMVIHGFRATARTWMQQNQVDFQVAEACLAHVESSKVVRAYARYDYFKERAEVLAKWNEFLFSILPEGFLV